MYPPQQSSISGVDPMRQNGDRIRIPMTMVGLDVTEKAIMLPEDEKELRGFGTKSRNLRGRSFYSLCLTDALKAERMP